MQQTVQCLWSSMIVTASKCARPEQDHSISRLHSIQATLRNVFRQLHYPRTINIYKNRMLIIHKTIILRCWTKRRSTMETGCANINRAINQKGEKNESKIDEIQQTFAHTANARGMGDHNLSWLACWALSRQTALPHRAWTRRANINNILTN